MGLFHHDKGQHILDHFKASHGDGWVVLEWQVKGAPEQTWRILRSPSRVAKTIEDGGEQTVVYEGCDTSFRDQDVMDDVDYYYTVFWRAPDGGWVAQAHVKVAPAAELRWEREEREDLDAAEYDVVMSRLTLGDPFV